MIPSEVKTDTVMTWTTLRTLWFPLLIAALLLAACSGEDPAELPPGVVEGEPNVLPASAAPTSPATPTPTGSVQPASCPNESAVAEDQSRQLGTSVAVDVDGDGGADKVWLASDPAGTAGCAAFVVADLAAGPVVAAPVWQIGAEGGLPQPRFHGSVDIDGQPGAEILVDEAAGASTQFVGVFVYVDEDLQRVTADDDLGTEGIPGGEGLFPYGGSVGHIEAVDCAGDGTVVVSSASPDMDQAAQGVYEIRRRFYVFDEAALERDEVETSEVPIDQIERFPEYQASPFGSC